MFKFHKKAWCSVLIAAAMAICTAWVAFAETHTEFTTGNPLYSPKKNEVAIISNTVDFSDLDTTGAGTAGAISGVTRSDTVALLDIPAGTVVLQVGVYIASAWGTSGLTCYGATIGDGDDTAGWISAVDFGPTASGTSISSGGTTYIIASGGGQYAAGGKYGNAGKYYSSADTIDATLPAWAHRATAGLTDFILRPWAMVIKPSTQEAYTH